MKLSNFGNKFTGHSGILNLMDDLGTAMATGSGDVLMLGGGNPGRVPAMEELFRTRMEQILANPGEFERMVGHYDPPEGNREFRIALAALLRRQFGWDISEANVALTNGSQSAFFMLFNMFAGASADGALRKVLLPLTPEYIGYADAGVSDDFFAAARPTIEHLDERLFKYHVDFDSVSIGDDIGAICVSRPTNPTGNVLTQTELAQLLGLAREHEVPLIVDNAYGTPFPHIIFTDADPIWNDHCIVLMSLSKLGLPGVRTGIVIAREDIIKGLAGVNAILNLSTGSVGAALTLDMVRSGDVIRLSRELITPFYQSKAQAAIELLRRELDGYEFYIHKPEGAIFLWLWFKGLPISSDELYERLKKRKVLVISGHHFFPGLAEPWRHRHECIRVTYSQDSAVVSAGLKIIAEEVKNAYRTAESSTMLGSAPVLGSGLES